MSSKVFMYAQIFFKFKYFTSLLLRCKSMCPELNKLNSKWNPVAWLSDSLVAFWWRGPDFVSWNVFSNGELHYLCLLRCYCMLRYFSILNIDIVTSSLQRYVCPELNKLKSETRPVGSVISSLHFDEVLTSFPEFFFLMDNYSTVCSHLLFVFSSVLSPCSNFVVSTYL